MTTSSGEQRTFSLTPVALVPSTVKTQASIASVCAVLIAVVTSVLSFKFGFAHDDFTIIEAISRHAFRVEAVIGDPIITAHGIGPLSSMMLMLENALWGTNAIWYHLINVVLYSICALLVTQIAIQISGSRGHRLSSAAAVWVAILFALYPLHADLSSWITAQVDLLYGAAYLSTIFFYFRLRTLREKGYLNLMMLSFGISLLTKTSGVFLPAIVLLSELLVFNERADRKLSQRLVVPAMLFMLFGFAVTIGMVSPHVFASPALSGTLAAWVEIVSSPPAWIALLMPIPTDETTARTLLWAAYGCMAVALALRLFWKSGAAKVILWLVCLAALSMVPDAGLGSDRFSVSRLLLVPSAAACLAIVFAALPALDQLPRKRMVALTVLGLIPLTVAAAIFYLSYAKSIQGWSTASSHFQSIVQTLQESSTNLTPDKKILLVNVPPDVGSADEINSAVRSPFQRFGLRNDLLIHTSQSGSGQHFIWPDTLKDTLVTNQVGKVMVWHDETNKLLDWAPLGGAPRFTLKFDKQTFPTLLIEPPQVRTPVRDKITGLKETGSAITPLSDGVRILPGRNRITIWAPSQSINPFTAGAAGIIIDYTSQTGCKTCHNGAMSFVWEGETGSHGEVRKISGRAAITNNSFGQYIVWLGRYPQWTFARRITRLGIQLEPGDYYVDIKSLDLIPSAWTAPRIALQSDANVFSGGIVPPQLKLNSKAAILFDAKLVPGVRGVKVIVTGNDVSFDPTNEKELYAFLPIESGAPLVNGDFASASSAVALPQKLMESEGTYQARAACLNTEGVMMGLPSEPLRFKIVK